MVTSRPSADRLIVVLSLGGVTSQSPPNAEKDSRAEINVSFTIREFVGRLAEYIPAISNEQEAELTRRLRAKAERFPGRRFFRTAFAGVRRQVAFLLWPFWSLSRFISNGSIETDVWIDRPPLGHLRQRIGTLEVHNRYSVSQTKKKGWCPKVMEQTPAPSFSDSYFAAWPQTATDYGRQAPKSVDTHLGSNDRQRQGGNGRVCAGAPSGRNSG
jgi:hypothetical protein